MDPSYRIVVAEAKFSTAGKFVADLGFYNPKTKNISLDKEQVLAWLNKGAKPSNTLAKLLKKEKVSHASVVIKTRNRPAKAKEEKEATPAQPATKTEEPVASADEPKTSPAEEAVQESSAGAELTGTPAPSQESAEQESDQTEEASADK